MGGIATPLSIYLEVFFVFGLFSVSVSCFLLCLISEFLWVLLALRLLGSSSGVLELLFLAVPTLWLACVALRVVVLSPSLFDVVCVGHVLFVVGSQWFWSFSFSGAVLFLFSPEAAAAVVVVFLGDLRLVCVVQAAALFQGALYRLALCSSDVVHAFAFPCVGLKCDVVPGLSLLAPFWGSLSGRLLGQCSEVCGSFHGFMPVAVFLV